MDNELTSVSSLAPAPIRSAIVVGHLDRELYLLQSPDNRLVALSIVGEIVDGDFSPSLVQVDDMN